MKYEKNQICCFSGYRPQKMDLRRWEAAVEEGALPRAIRRAAMAGYVVFLSGMSRGFDLWAAQEVLALREELGLQLWGAVPFAAQDERWEEEWQAIYRKVLAGADRVFCLSDTYTPDCMYERNRFLVEGSGRLICWYDKGTGGTANTIRLARRKGLYIDNLANPQTTLWQF